MCWCARLAASDERCGVFCTKLRVRGAFQCAKLCRGVQVSQVRCGTSGSVARCNGDAVACNKDVRWADARKLTKPSVGSKFAVAILNEASDPSQPSADAPHRLPSTLRASGHEPPHFGLGPTKHDPDPSEQPL